jgi:hypothetical protein
VIGEFHPRAYVRSGRGEVSSSDTTREAHSLRATRWRMQSLLIRRTSGSLVHAKAIAPVCDTAAGE